MRIAILVVAMAILHPALAPAASAHPGTVVILRHGEKPPVGLGQLSCQGLNRSLGLPAVIERKFGRPAAVYAPDPAATKGDGGIQYDYVRPLATVEPTAIYFGLPVDASVPFTDIVALAARIRASAQGGGTVLVAWEHKLIPSLARLLLGPGARVPEWRSADFDSMYVLSLDRSPGRPAFRIESEGLAGLAVTCPGQRP